MVAPRVPEKEIAHFKCRLCHGTTPPEGCMIGGLLECSTCSVVFHDWLKFSLVDVISGKPWDVIRLLVQQKIKESTERTTPGVVTHFHCVSCGKIRTVNDCKGGVWITPEGCKPQHELVCSKCDPN